MKLLTFEETDFGSFQPGHKIESINIPQGTAWIVLGDDGMEVARGGPARLLGKVPDNSKPNPCDSSSPTDRVPVAEPECGDLKFPFAPYTDLSHFCKAFPQLFLNAEEVSWVRQMISDR